MTHRPVISVVMPVHNAERYIDESVKSILAQEPADIELIVVDDGSTDASVARLESIGDSRMRIIRQSNQGVARALMTGMEQARAAIIARHDADDVALPGRLSAPLGLLRARPEIGIVGAAATVTDADGRPTGELRHAQDDASIRYAALFDSPFVHPTVMFRRSAYDLAGGYRDDATVFEDHDLWWRMSKVTRMANISDVLLRYREVPTSASRMAKRNERTMEQRRRNLIDSGVPEREALLLSRSGFHHDLISFAELRSVRAQLKRLVDTSGAEGAERAHLKADAYGRLRGFHLNRRGNPIAKAIDRSLMHLLLNLPGTGNP